MYLLSLSSSFPTVSLSAPCFPSCPLSHLLSLTGYRGSLISLTGALCMRGRRMDTPKQHSCQLFWLHHTLYTPPHNSEPRHQGWAWAEARSWDPFLITTEIIPPMKVPSPYTHTLSFDLNNINVFPVTVNTYISINMLFIPSQYLGLFMEMSTCSFVGLYFDLRQRVIIMPLHKTNTAPMKRWGNRCSSTLLPWPETKMNRI